MEKEQVKILENQAIFTDKEEDSLQRKEWQEIVKEQENPCNDKTYSRLKKKALEEELTGLILVIIENKFMMSNMLTQMQETEDEIRLRLTLIRTDLKRSNDPHMSQEEVINWNVIKHRIETSLTKLERCHELQNLRTRYTLNLEHGKRQAEEKTEHELLGKVFEAITQMQNGQVEKKAERPLLKCYYCHEEGHFKRECPQRRNKKRWIQIPKFRKQHMENQFRQKTGFRHKQNTDGMYAGTSTAWPLDEDSYERHEKKQAMTK